MAELLTAKDKLPQVEQQIRVAEMERYVVNLRVQFAPDPLTADADAVEKAAHQQLQAEAEGAQAAVITWDRKLAVLRSAYDALKAEIAAQDAQKKT